MTTTQLIRNYDNFNYNSEFIPNFNVFNVSSSQYVGIGTTIPQHHLTVSNNININGNLIINGNFYLNLNVTQENYNSNYTHLLYKRNSNDFKVARLIYSSPDSKYSDYNFYEKNECLYINTNDDRPNTILTYKSPIYTVNNQNGTLVSNDLYTFTIDVIVSHKIYITHTFIFDSQNQYLNSNTITSLQINNISTNETNNIFKLDKTIELLPYQNNTLTINIDSSLSDKFIQFFGNYDFSAGNLWHNINTDIFTDKNVSILSNSNYNNKLYVNGGGLINYNYSTNILNTNIFTNTANLDIDNILFTKNIISNKLIIDSPEISFGNNSSSNLVTIGDTTFITNNGNLFLKDLNINNNINLHSIQNTNNEKLVLNNNININNFINLNNINTQFHYNTIISNNPSNINNYTFGNNTLLVDGNTFIDGTLKFDNITYDKCNLDGDYINANLNILHVTGLTHTGSFTKTNNIETNTFISPNINLLPSIQKTNTPGTIYYDTDENEFKAHTSTSIIKFNLATTQPPDNSNFILHNNDSKLQVHDLNIDLLDTTVLHSTYLDSNTTHTEYIKVPLYDKPTSDYVYDDLMGTMFFNNTNKRFEVHDGEKYNNIAFEEDIINTTDKYTIKANINLIKNVEQFIPTIPQNFKYNITQSDNSYYNSDITDTNRITINHINEKKVFNLNLDENFGIAINNNIIGIGTNFYILSNINVHLSELEEEITHENTLYSAEFNNHLDYDKNLNELYVHIDKSNNVTNATLNNTNNNESTDLKTYIDDQDTKVFSIKNNRLYVDDGNNLIDTYIKIKKKQLIGIDKYSGYLYYEPLLDYIELLNHTTSNKLTNIDVRIYNYDIYNSNIGSNRVKILYTLMSTYIEIYVNNSSYFRGDSIAIPSNKTVTLEIIDKRNFIYNIYTFKINS